MTLVSKLIGLYCIHYPVYIIQVFGVTDSPGNLGIQGCIVFIILFCIQVVGVIDSLSKTLVLRVVLYLLPSIVSR